MKTKLDKMHRQANNTPHVYFNNICERLIEHIEESEVVLGCVAWLTRSDVLDALSKRPCCIIVQEEDWNVGYRKPWYDRYQSLEAVGIEDLRKICPQLRNLKNYTNKAIRSVNLPTVHNQQPRMHHKFLIMFKKTGVGVWTGSFNITNNACQSLENATYIDFDPYIKPFVSEFFHVLCLSCELKDEWKPNKYFKLADKPNIDYTKLVEKVTFNDFNDEPLIVFDWDAPLNEIKPEVNLVEIKPEVNLVEINPESNPVEIDEKPKDKCDTQIDVCAITDVEKTNIDKKTNTVVMTGIKTFVHIDLSNYITEPAVTVLAKFANATNTVKSLIFK
jgi:hypothetical protein